MTPTTVADDGSSGPQADGPAEGPAEPWPPSPSRGRQLWSWFRGGDEELARRVRPAHWAALAFIVLGAFGLRFYDVGGVPAGLFCDEAALGYNAYTLGHFGIDENGKSFPLYVWSFFGYKNPVYIYSAAVPVRLFGLSRTSLRLTSVVFGTLTVLALFWLAYELWGPAAGLLAAGLLAVTPWNHHFSRVAFELIALPFLFVAGFAFLVRALRNGRWNWAGAGLAFGLCPYAYVISAVLVPAFLGMFVLLCAPWLWRQRKGFLLGVFVFALTWTPFVLFQLRQPESGNYFKGTTWIHEPEPLTAKAQRFWANYKEFYSSSFLFEQGDPIARHSTGQHGELHPSFRPLILVGLLLLVLPLRRLHLLVLHWAAIYPIGACLMNEIPTATRAVIGSPVGPLIAAYALWRILRLLQPLSRRGWRVLAQTVLALVFLVPVLRDTWKYLQIYHGPWKAQSARGYYGFQFGYQEILEYMQAHPEFPQRLLTANEVNQPEAIVNFYVRPDPHQWHKTKDNGYRVLWPQERGYRLDEPTLFAGRAEDTLYFEEYEIKKEIVAPDGVTEFVIIHPRKRKVFLTEWSVHGPLPAMGLTPQDPPPQPRAVPEPGPAAEVPIRWQPAATRYLNLDLNGVFGPHAGGNPENCCGEAVVYVKAERPMRDVQLEAFGSDDNASFWVNGEPALGPVVLSGQSARSAPIRLRAGWNEITLRACEGLGDWSLSVRLADAAGRSLELPQVSDPTGLALPKVVSHARIMDPRRRPGATQLAEGFAEVVRASHQDPKYLDYRGPAPGYWAYFGRGPQEVVWRTAPAATAVTTTFVFTGGSGEDRGVARLSINGAPILRFATGLDAGELAWEGEGGIQLQFVPKARTAGFSGYYFLTVPGRHLRAGSPIEVAVTLVEGGNVTWFMVKDRRDTITHERIGIQP